MEVRQEYVADFRRLYKEEFGKEISEDDARQRAQQLLMFYELVHRPLPDDDVGDSGDEGDATTSDQRIV